MQPDLDRVCRNPQGTCDLFAIQLFDVAEQENCPIGVREAGDALPYKRTGFLTLQQDLTRGLPACWRIDPLALFIKTGEEVFN